MLAGKSLLLVEDDESYTETVSYLFELFAPEALLTCASTLMDGLAALTAKHYDAILLDMRLPDADDLTGLYHFLAAVPSTPVIILTAYSHLRDEALRAGAWAYLPKADLLGESLIAALDRLLA